MKNSLGKKNSVLNCLVRILFRKPLCIHYKNSMTPKKQLVSSFIWNSYSPSLWVLHMGSYYIKSTQLTSIIFHSCIKLNVLKSNAHLDNALCLQLNPWIINFIFRLTTLQEVSLRDQKLTKWHSPKAKRIVLLWDAWRDFLSSCQN